MGKKRKKLIAIMITILITVLGGLSYPIRANANSVYQASDALSYASNHWNDGVGLCAEFVSNCLNAGGISPWSISCTALRTQLLNSGLGTEYELKLENDMSIKASDYTGKLEAGDVVFYYCPGCTDGKPYIHAVLCNGMDSNGYMRAYSHNNANSGQSKYKYSTDCYACGTEISKAVVYHFNTFYNPQGDVDCIIGGEGTVSVRGWAFDKDNVDAELEIHVYVDGVGYGFHANKERTDVGAVYPGVGDYHGFERELVVDARGETKVDIFAINVGGGTNVLIGSKTVTIKKPYEINFDVTDVSVKSGETTVVNMDFAGDNIYTMSYEIADSEICSVEWGSVNWSTGKTSLVIKGKKEGETEIVVRMLDTERNILFQNYFKVTTLVSKGTVEISKDSISLNTLGNTTESVVLKWSDCENAVQVLPFHTGDVEAVEVSYENVTTNSLSIVYTAKEEGTVAGTYKIVDAYGNELGKATIKINVVEKVIIDEVGNRIPDIVVPSEKPELELPEIDWDETKKPEIEETETEETETEESETEESETDNGSSESDILEGWVNEDGYDYWYEDGIKQGLEGRGKEIFDPQSNAWYWLDAVQQGKIAKSKDVYQESWAGIFADRENGTGKWVRYDSNGHMVKGWNEKDGKCYYFDLETGAMVKGIVSIDGEKYYFDRNTGEMQNPETLNGWYRENGRDYWYENGVRQGYDPNNSEYRGKEIYDPESAAWYWLDNVQQGAKAVNKDVYQESWAGEFADREDGTGKWVRYDSNGYMIKGWDEQNGNTYYFDLTTGAMVKGSIVIDGITYKFNEFTGILESD